MDIKKVFIIPAFVLLFGCGNQIEEKDLIGSWKVSEFKADTPELSPPLIEAASQEALSTTYTFQKDKTYQMKSDYISEGMSGQYDFETLTNRIKMMRSPQEGDSYEEYEVEFINKNSMKLTQNMAELGRLTMTLTKK